MPTAHTRVFTRTHKRARILPRTHPQPGIQGPRPTRDRRTGERRRGQPRAGSRGRTPTPTPGLGLVPGSRPAPASRADQIAKVAPGLKHGTGAENVGKWCRAPRAPASAGDTAGGAALPARTPPRQRGLPRGLRRPRVLSGRRRATAARAFLQRRLLAAGSLGVRGRRAWASVSPDPAGGGAGCQRPTRPPISRESGRAEAKVGAGNCALGSFPDLL